MSSAETVISFMIAEIKKSQPKRILDIGIGFGKWGFLCREYLEGWNNRIYPDQWEIRIDGIEIWKPFVDKLPWNKVLYNNIYIGDAHELINKLPDYDLIIAGDVIEHFSKQKGIDFIKKLIKKSKCLLVSIPLGNWMNNSIVDNNPYEAHQAIWTLEDIINLGRTELGCNIKTYNWEGIRGNGCIGVFKNG